MTAARIAETFGIDPVVVLDADPDIWMIRAAALTVIANDRREAEEERKARRNRSV